MSKIIKIKSDYKSTPEYRAVLTNTIEKLDNINADLHSLIVNLATAGKWKKWSDNISEGEVFYFTEEMLKDTGDNNVDGIAELLDEVIKLKEKIENNLHNK